VTYGYDTYVATDCVVVGNGHDLIECLTSAGVGQYLRWSVTIKEQESDWSPGFTWYAPPTIEAVYAGPELESTIAKYVPCQHALTLTVDSLSTPMTASTLSIVMNGLAAPLLTPVDRIRRTPGNVTHGDLYELYLQPDLHISGAVPYRVDETFMTQDAMVTFVLDGSKSTNVPLPYLVGLGETMEPLRLTDSDFGEGGFERDTVTDTSDASLFVFSVKVVPSESSCDMTSDGGAVRVVGRNFGVMDVNALQFVSYEGDIYPATIVNRDSSDSAGGDVYPLHELEVILPPGFGLDHPLAVLTCSKKPSVEVQFVSKALCTGNPVSSGIELIDYVDPHIRSLVAYERIKANGTPEPDSVNLKIVGSNFGSVGLVFLMPRDMRSPWVEAQLIMDSNGVPKYKDSEIEIVSPYTSGYVKVNILSYFLTGIILPIFLTGIYCFLFS
jgi:hypothetical protein